MRAIIMRCSDPLLWYSNSIGKEIDVANDGSEYLTRDNGGFINIVNPADIQIYPECKHQDFFDKVFADLENPREYRIFTEIFWYLHGGIDYCNCNEVLTHKQSVKK